MLLVHGLRPGAVRGSMPGAQRQFEDGDDLVEEFRLCGESPAAASRTYVLAGPRCTPLDVGIIVNEENVPPPCWRFPVWPFRVAGALCAATCVPRGIEPPLYRRPVDFFLRNRAFDATRARQELGFAPAVDLAEGVRPTADRYREQGWL